MGAAEAADTDALDDTAVADQNGAQAADADRADADAAAQVRPMLPSDVSNLVLWLDAADLAPGPFGLWQDKSGLSNFGTAQPDSTAQMVVEVHTHLPVLEMSGTADFVSWSETFPTSRRVWRFLSSFTHGCLTRVESATTNEIALERYLSSKWHIALGH